MVKKTLTSEKVLTLGTTVDKVPSIQHRGKTKIDLKPLLERVQQKGILRISEDEAVLGTLANNVIEQSKKYEIPVVCNFRTENKKRYLFVSKVEKRK